MRHHARTSSYTSSSESRSLYSMPSFSLKPPPALEHVRHGSSAQHHTTPHHTTPHYT